mmetsp:Transcript_44305/g.50009  ORF Transcript_44305/g.50009 Transcript_44305/m.50009 type:complete len:577 (-) Transcript_44305:1807-3537(-)
MTKNIIVLLFILWFSSGPKTTTIAFVALQSTVTTTTTRRSIGNLLRPSIGNTIIVHEYDEKTSSSLASSLEPFLKGVKRDFGNRFPQYKSDIYDGINTQSLATILFLFFACLAPAVGFGGVLSALTGNQMGVIEMVASTSLSGMLYALFSAQPVQLIGPQGPVVAFIAAIFLLSSSLQVPFLTLYTATGFIASLCLTSFAVTSASNFVASLTRWTDEIFSVLVSVLFLSQALGDVSATFAFPVNTIVSSTMTTTALLTLVTCTSTFGTALTLKNLPKTRYLSASLRKNLANFAPAIGVVVGSFIAHFAWISWGPLGVLPALQLPSKFVTSTGRSWSLLSTVMATLNSKLWLAAVPTGIAAAMLLYLDQNITARLVNHPRFKQTKGERSSVLDGMHGDMLTLAAVTAISSVFGLPWMCGAPTRSAAHVRALSVVDESSGDIKGTIENRVTGFFIHALIGLCAVATAPRNFLGKVPKAALSGIFLYLGFTSLQGLEFWDRIRGLYKDVVIEEKFKNVKRSKITYFTAVQMACVWTMMKVTNSKIGVISPVLIALLPFVRWGLIKAKVVTDEDMKALDT